MIELIKSHYIYWLLFGLMMIGLYVVISHGNLVKKLIGLSLFQVGVFLFYISLGRVDGGSAPIISEDVEVYSHPLPQVLILTAIVVGVATLAVGLALAARIFEAYDTVEEDEVHERDTAEHDAVLHDNAATGTAASGTADPSTADPDTGEPGTTDRDGGGS